MKERNSLGLYIHIPFCIKKCNYCDFCSFPIENVNSLVDEYVYKLCNEIESKAKKYSSSYYVDTIFFGGGTPSLIGADQIGRILIAIKNKFNVLDDAEISIEANPETVTKQKAEIYRFLGFNRVSIGIQSLDDVVLKVLGRVHDADKAREAFKSFREAGFDNINIDLMLGVPGQDFESFKNSLNEVISLSPEHISFYGLQIEEGTPFYSQYRSGEIDIPTWEENRKMYHYAVDALKTSGYHHYEISNAAKHGYECKHNLKYWTMKDYLGFGAAAHSFVDGVRFFNTDDLEYKELTEESDNLDLSREGDRIFTGLRLIDGTDFGKDFCDKYSLIINTLIDEGYINKKEYTLKFTKKGLDATNIVMGRFLNA